MSVALERIKTAKTRTAELARTGDYRDWTQVEKALLAEGMNEVRIVFNDPQACERITEVCRIAQGAKARGITFDEAWAHHRKG